MMNDATKTGIAIVAAAGLCFAAYVTRPTPITDASFSDQGEQFFSGFADPTAARSLEVISYDEATASFRPFKVEFAGNRWVIPSHHNYPADAQKAMAEAASVFVGLTKEQVVSDRAADHEALGVLAPDDSAAPLKGRGTRVTLKGENGAVLSDIIIGKAVGLKDDPGAPAEGPGTKRYVRLPGKNRVYAVTFTKGFSTKFSDWVETDLLKIGAEPIESIVVDRYKVDEQAGTRTDVEKLSISRKAALPPPAPGQPAPAPGWNVVAEPGGGPGPGETVTTARIDEIVAALAQLKIAGVRPKPPKLAAWFSGQSKSVTQMDVLDMQSRGFFVTREGQFVANDGELTATAADGVVYHLYFGEVLFGQGDAISAGADENPIAAKAEGDGKAPASAEAKKEGSESRYVFVRVGYDPAMIPEPVKPAVLETAAAPSAATPKPAASDGSQPKEEGAPSLAADAEKKPEPAPPDPAVEAARKEYEQKVADRNAKVEAGKKRAEALTKRFADWYYVIDAQAFARLRPSRGEVIVTATPPAAPAPAPGTTPPGQPPASPAPASSGHP